MGAPILVTPTWPIAALAITAVFGPTIASMLPGSTIKAYTVAFAYAILLFGSVLLHEVAHAVVAHLRGKQVHSVSLSLWGGQTTFADDEPHPGSAVLIALAGPVTNLVLAGAAWFLLEQTTLTDGYLVARLLLAALAWSNAFVGLFNLIPGLPLDGGQVLEAIVWKITGRRAQGATVAGWVGRAVAIGVLVTFIGYPLTQGNQPSMFAVLWAALISFFLWQNAGAAIRNAHRREAIDSLDLRPLIRPVVAVADTATVADVLVAQRQFYAAATSTATGPEPSYGARVAGPLPIVLVAHGARPVAIVDDDALRRVPPEAAASTSVSAVATTLVPGAAIDGAVGREAFTTGAMNVLDQAPIVLVITAGEVVGGLYAADVAGQLRHQGILG